MEKKTRKGKVKREFSAGGVVFKKRGNKILWLVTKSRKSELYPRGVWRLPKGWIDDEGEDKPGQIARGLKKATERELQRAAVREVEEEGGVKAKIVLKIGTTSYFITLSGRKTLKFVTFYLMEFQKVLPKGPEWETEKVRWLPFKEAHKRLSYSGEKKLLEKAESLLVD